jgi:IS5 family transposase
MEHNRSLKLMEKINVIIDWSKVETLLMEHYTVGSSKEGADTYPPLMLLRALLLQKWFKVKSDPEYAASQWLDFPFLNKKFNSSNESIYNIF